MSSANPDDMFALAQPALARETSDIICQLRPGDFTPIELVALAALLRPVYERTQIEKRPPAPVLKLAPRKQRPVRGEVTTRSESSKDPVAAYGSMCMEAGDEPAVDLDHGPISPDATRALAAALNAAADLAESWVPAECTTCAQWDSCPRHPKADVLDSEVHP